MFSVDKLTKYDINNSHNNAIYCVSSYGPIFGSGYNIIINDNSNANTNSSTCSGNVYNLPAGANGGSSILTNGTSNFQTTEIEVYLMQ